MTVFVVVIRTLYSPFQMLKAVFFDFDGTLADDGIAIDNALRTACSLIVQKWPDIDPAALEDRYRAASDHAWDNYDRYLRPLESGQAILVSLWKKALEKFNHHDEDTENRAAETYWQQRLINCRPFPDVVSCLSGLEGRFHLSILTNGASGMQRSKIDATGIAHFFKDIFVGGEFPVGKPEPFIFDKALKRAGCQPYQAIYVGDSLLHDVAGANNSGIHSVWLNRKKRKREDLLETFAGPSGRSLKQLTRSVYYEPTKHSKDISELFVPDSEIDNLDVLAKTLEKLPF